MCCFLLFFVKFFIGSVVIISLGFFGLVLVNGYVVVNIGFGNVDIEIDNEFDISYLVVLGY